MLLRLVLLLLVLMMSSFAVLLDAVSAETMQAGALFARAEPKALRSMPARHVQYHAAENGLCRSYVAARTWLTIGK